MDLSGRTEIFVTRDPSSIAALFDQSGISPEREDRFAVLDADTMMPVGAVIAIASQVMGSSHHPLFRPSGLPVIPTPSSTMSAERGVPSPSHLTITLMEEAQVEAAFAAKITKLYHGHLLHKAFCSTSKSFPEIFSQSITAGCASELLRGRPEGFLKKVLSWTDRSYSYPDILMRAICEKNLKLVTFLVQKENVPDFPDIPTSPVEIVRNRIRMTFVLALEKKSSEVVNFFLHHEKTFPLIRDLLSDERILDGL